MSPVAEQTVPVGPGRRVVRVILAAGMLAIGVAILAFAMSANSAANRDYIAYWAVGHQLVHHSNPYDGPEILRLEWTAGLTDNRPSFISNPPTLRNPPIFLFLMALPLGYVDARMGAVLWSLALVAALMASIRLLWIMHGRPADRLHLVGYCFAPVLACLLAGQIGIFILLGVVLFLYFHETRPYLAGSALLLCSLKPHLFLPFGVVLLAWAVARKAYGVLIGAGLALAGSATLSLILDPAGWSQYAKMAAAAKVQDEFIPTVSLFFRLALDRHAFWIQFVPAAVGCAWALWYFRTRRDRWSWADHGALLLLVSVMVAPYAWFTDESVLLPAVLLGLYRASDAGRSLLPFGFIAGIALIEVLAGVTMTSGFYAWTAPAWLAWYLFATRGLQAKNVAEAAEITVVDA
jgi:hypothetical protein